jgi:hypothetical protein
MMTVPYVVCSYHTDDDIYTEEAARLRASLERFGLPHHIRSIPKGALRWKDACRLKAAFIAEMLALHQRDVLWLDADAAVLAHPALFDAFTGDLGVRLRPPGELLSATVYIKNSERGRFLVREWVRFTDENPKWNDQPALQQVVTTHGPQGIVSLPESYAHKFPLPGSNAVIGQYQASRKVRNRAGGGPV